MFEYDVSAPIRRTYTKKDANSWILRSTALALINLLIFTIPAFTQTFAGKVFYLESFNSEQYIGALYVACLFGIIGTIRIYDIMIKLTLQALGDSKKYEKGQKPVLSRDFELEFSKYTLIAFLPAVCTGCVFISALSFGTPLAVCILGVLGVTGLILLVQSNRT